MDQLRINSLSSYGYFPNALWHLKVKQPMKNVCMASALKHLIVALHRERYDWMDTVSSYSEATQRPEKHSATDAGSHLCCSGQVTFTDWTDDGSHQQIALAFEQKIKCSHPYKMLAMFTDTTDDESHQQITSALCKRSMFTSPHAAVSCIRPSRQRRSQWVCSRAENSAII